MKKRSDRVLAGESRVAIPLEEDAAANNNGGGAVSHGQHQDALEELSEAQSKASFAITRNTQLEKYLADLKVTLTLTLSPGTL